MKHNKDVRRCGPRRQPSFRRTAPTILLALVLGACGAGADRIEDSAAQGSAARGSRLPDVVISSLAYSSATGTFAATVENNGRGRTPSDTAIGVAYFADDEYLTWGSVGGPLAAGASVVVGTDGGAVNIAPGVHTIRAWVDDVNRFTETNETNNQRSQTIAIAIDGAPAISGGAPSGVLPAGTTSTTMSVTTNEPATCMWGAEPDTTYDSLPNAFAATGGTSHSTLLTGLTDGESYARYVRCRDGSGNVDTVSSAINFQVDSAPGPGPGPSANVLWRDDIQTSGSPSPWGFSEFTVEHPIGTAVSPSDANGANLSRVADPLSGGGFALRHFATFDNAGSRSQAGIYSFANTVFNDQAKRPEGVWVAQEWYFPQAITAGGDLVPWINLWDWHSTDAGGGNRWHTSPGLMLVEDGSMKVRWEWGGPAQFNPSSGSSTVALPVGKWFDVEMHYTWTTATTTISFWINGVLALEQSGVTTRAPSHANVEFYSKFYGSRNGGNAWSPTPSVRYTRNVRIGNGRIWH